MRKANIHADNTVLMLEGGGMRASYTAGGTVKNLSQI